MLILQERPLRNWPSSNEIDRGLGASSATVIGGQNRRLLVSDSMLNGRDHTV